MTPRTTYRIMMGLVDTNGGVHWIDYDRHIEAYEVLHMSETFKILKKLYPEHKFKLIKTEETIVL